MKAISLWQPWASAMAVGSKTIETRHWPTNVRGSVAIHAAKRLIKNELIYFGSCWSWVGALQPLGAKFGNDWHICDELPFGAIVAVGELIDCCPTDRITLGEIEVLRFQEEDKGRLYGWTEKMMGNYELGRYAWTFKNIRPLAEPIPYKGGQGFFNVPDELLEGKY